MNNPIARKEKLVVQEMPDEVLVYDLSAHKAHCLNKTAAFVWSQCDGKTNVSGLAQLLREEFKTPFDETFVWSALDQLNKANLLEAKTECPKDVLLKSRRRLLGKLGPAALLSVPLVLSITAPTALAGASVPVDCTACATSLGKGGTCPAACTGSVTGGCYGNNSCGGQGQFLGCMSCSACISAGGSSWRAPDVC